MAEYVKREYAIDAVLDVYYNTPDIDLSGGKFEAEILKIPVADVSPVRHGRWIMKHRRRGGFRRYTGIDDMGEQHTIIVDERVEYDDRYCSECGKQSADNFLNYCPNCGAKMDLNDSED